MRFCAFSAVDQDNGWVQAGGLAPFLSGMMHCMQLWLAGWCLDAVEVEDEEDGALEEAVKHECKQFLKNDTHSPLAELSYWRLLAWKVNEDTVLHPVTTISEDLSTVRHLHVELKFDSLRDALHAVLQQAKDMLEQDLMLGLATALRYSLWNLSDNFANLGPGFCFLEDPRNELGEAKERVANPTTTCERGAIESIFVASR